MPRYGKCPIPKTRAAFIAFVRRVEATVYRRCAEDCARRNPPRTTAELSDLFAGYATARKHTATWVEELAASSAADRDDCLTSEYHDVMRLVRPGP